MKQWNLLNSMFGYTKKCQSFIRYLKKNMGWCEEKFSLGEMEKGNFY